jgi:DNA-binding HxlR family transcriptional regulator
MGHGFLVDNYLPFGKCHLMEQLTATTAAPSQPADVFSVACPARSILDVLAEKWVLLIVHSLQAGPARPGELRRRIQGISEKMLVQTLRRLQAFGIVDRRDYAEVPPRVEYRLTPLGISLSPLVKAFDSWVEDNAETIEAARTRSADS